MKMPKQSHVNCLCDRSLKSDDSLTKLFRDKKYDVRMFLSKRPFSRAPKRL